MINLVFKYPRNRITDVLLSLLCLFVIVLIIQYDSASRTLPVISGIDEVISFLECNNINVLSSEPDIDEIVIDASRADVFEEYNRIQLEQGFDLTEYIGRKVLRYNFEVNSEDGSPNYAVVLVCNGVIIGADIHSVSLNGFIRGVKNKNAENQIG